MTNKKSHFQLLGSLVVVSLFLIFFELSTWILLFSVISNSLLDFFSNCYKFYYKTNCVFGYLFWQFACCKILQVKLQQEQTNLPHFITSWHYVLVHSHCASIMFLCKQYKYRLHCLNRHLQIFYKGYLKTTKSFLSCIYWNIISEFYLLMH